MRPKVALVSQLEVLGGARGVGRGWRKRKRGTERRRKWRRVPWRREPEGGREENAGETRKREGKDQDEGKMSKVSHVGLMIKEKMYSSQDLFFLYMAYSNLRLF